MNFLNVKHYFGCRRFKNGSKILRLNHATCSELWHGVCVYSRWGKLYSVPAHQRLQFNFDSSDGFTVRMYTSNVQTVVTQLRLYLTNKLFRCSKYIHQVAARFGVCRNKWEVSLNRSLRTKRPTFLSAKSFLSLTTVNRKSCFTSSNFRTSTCLRNDLFAKRFLTGNGSVSIYEKFEVFAVVCKVFAFQRIIKQQIAAKLKQYCEFTYVFTYYPLLETLRFRQSVGNVPSSTKRAHLYLLTNTFEGS